MKLRGTRTLQCTTMCRWIFFCAFLKHIYIKCLLRLTLFSCLLSYLASEIPWWELSPCLALWVFWQFQLSKNYYTWLNFFANSIINFKTETNFKIPKVFTPLGFLHGKIIISSKYCWNEHFKIWSFWFLIWTICDHGT